MSDEKKVLLSVQIKAEQALTEIAKTRKAIEELRSIQKGLDRTTEEGRVQYEQYGASIRELSGKLREQTKQYDTHTKYVQAESESLEELKARLSLLTAEYNKMSKAQRNSEEGLVLKDNINQITNELKDAEQEVGNFRRSVGDYENSIREALGLNSSFMVSIREMAGGAKETGTSFGAQAVGGIKAFGKALYSIMAIPIVAVIAIIVGVIMSLSKAIKSNGEATEKLKQIMAPLKDIFTFLVGIVGKLVSTILDGVLALGKFASKIASVIPGVSKLNSKLQESLDLERERQRLAREERADIVDDAKTRLKVAELKKQISQKDKYTAEERLRFAREADRLERENMEDDLQRAERNYNSKVEQMRLLRKTQKDLTDVERDDLANAEAEMYNLRAEYFEKTKRLGANEAQLQSEIDSERQASIQKAQQQAEQNAQKRIELAQRTAQAENALLNIKVSGELKAFSEIAGNEKLTLSERLQALNDFKKKQEQLINDNASFEKSNKELTDAEIKVIDEKAKQDRIDLENATNKQIEDLNKAHLAKTLNDYKVQIEKRNFENEQAYEEDYLKLIKQLDKGNITTEEFKKQKASLVRKYEVQSFNDTLDLLEKQLTIEGITGDQKLDIQRAIDAKRLQMKQQANDAELESTKERIQKEKALEIEFSNLKRELYSQLQQSIAEISGAVFTNRLLEIDSEKEAVKESAESQRQAIDEKERAGVLSRDKAESQKRAIDARTRAEEKKLEAEKKKTQRDQVIAEKLFATFSIGLSTAQAIMKSLAQTPLPLGAPFVAMNAALGALQIASVLSQPLPKASMGMLLRGKSHAFGGIPIEAEDGEAIINKRSTSMFAPLLSLINEAGGGVPFMPHANRLMDGGYSVRSYQKSDLSRSDIAEAMKEAVREIKIYTTVEDIRREDKKYTEIEDRMNL